MSSPCQSYREFLETLTPEGLHQLKDHVAPDVRFCDPFNDVQGADGMERVFHHMFENVGPVKFIVSKILSEGDTCLMAWRFEARLRNAPWSFEGTSAIRFDVDGRVTEHIDYWDAAALYERLPIIGWLLRKVRRKLAIR
jgi:steroid delta-isomerase